MAKEFPRRQLFRLAAGGAAGATLAALGLEAASLTHTTLIEQQRLQASPELIYYRRPNSFVYGTAANDNDPENALQLGHQLGKTPHIINFFPRYLSPNTPAHSYIRHSLELGFLPLISLHINDKLPSRQQLSDLARTLNTFPGPTMISPWYEFNGPWANVACQTLPERILNINTWYGHLPPDKFIPIWREMYQIIKSIAPQTQIVWRPNCTNNFTIPGFSDYFPGESFVDIFGLDGYNKHKLYLINLHALSQGNLDQVINPDHVAHPNLSPLALFGEDLRQLQLLSRRIPILVTEINTTLEKGGGKWFQQAVQFFSHVRQVAGWVSFDRDKQGAGEHAWNILNYPAIINHLKPQINLAHYAPLTSPQETLRIIHQAA